MSNPAEAPASKKPKVDDTDNRPLHSITPTIASVGRSNAFGAPVYLKLENIQASGSFKLRGIGLLAQRAAEKNKIRLISSSGGNAGLATAYAARALGLTATVVVPESTPQSARDRIASYGATVRVHGAAWDDADVLAREIVASAPDDCEYVPPFNHPTIWEGHATMISEIQEHKQLQHPPAAVVVSVGGGGLLCGVVEGLKKTKGWEAVPVIAVETIGADSLFQAMQQDKLVTLPAITSIAKSLGAKTVGEATLKCTREHKVIPVTVTDLEAVDACLALVEEHRMLVEPACGASLALAEKPEEVAKLLNCSAQDLSDKGLLVIVCGGSLADMKTLEAHKADLSTN